VSRLQPGIAANHPATTQAGLEILEEGGSAADAAVAGSLASCAAEVVMTGLAGGGHALWIDGATGRAANLDFFVAVPGLGRPPRELRVAHVPIPFGTEIIEYSVGIDSCAVPGVPAGLEELWRRHGRLPWARLVEPAIALARDGVPMPRAHALCLDMLAAVMTLGEGAKIFSPGGSLLGTGDPLVQPGLARAFEIVAGEGARSMYEGTLAAALIELMEEHDGPVTRDDLAAYEPRWRDPVVTRYAGTEIATRGSLSRLPETLAALPPLPRSPGERAVTLARALAGPPADGHTTNLVTVDRDGNVCVLTTSLGLGSGDFIPDLQIHLNSMLGEADLIVGPLVPGERMESMMAPTAAFDADGPVVALGSAGGSRLRSAIVQTLAGILDEGLAPQEAVDRPRLHPVGSVVHVEPGFPEEALSALADAGFEVRRWEARHHYFGGVSLCARRGAAADPRRSGSTGAPRS
jgi:gamma-glutamyltranspeptidase/glutathione hydrolase